MTPIALRKAPNRYTGENWRTQENECFLHKKRKKKKKVNLDTRTDAWHLATRCYYSGRKWWKNCGFSVTLSMNLPINSVKVNETAYKGIVRPILEYSSSVWDPHHQKYKSQLEMVQRRVARFTLGRYNNQSSVSDMLYQLQWETLEDRRRKARLTMFFKILMCMVAVPLPPMVTSPPRPRQDTPTISWSLFVEQKHTNTDLFPYTLTQWNQLPASIACQTRLYLPSSLVWHLYPSKKRITILLTIYLYSFIPTYSKLPYMHPLLTPTPLRNGL